MSASTSQSRDRTSEFLSLCERLQRQYAASTSGASAAERGPLLPSRRLESAEEKSEFARRASRIGLGIHQVSQKLQRLSQLARQTSMFNDPAQQINELTAVVKSDLQSLNGAITDLQNFVATGTSGVGSKQSKTHSATVVDSLRGRLKDATENFRNVLTSRTESLRQHQERKQIFSGVAQGPAPSGPRPPPFAASPAPGVGGATPSFLLGTGFEGGASGGAEPSMGPLMQQSQVQTQAQAPQSYLDSRADALRQVESTIHELGGMFQQLAGMVQEQGEMALRIDENMDDTLMNVEAAQGQLLKYLNAISSNRWLALKILGVVLVFMVFFILFIA